VRSSISPPIFGRSVTKERRSYGILAGAGEGSRLTNVEHRQRDSQELVSLDPDTLRVRKTGRRARSRRRAGLGAHLPHCAFGRLVYWHGQVARLHQHPSDRRHWAILFGDKPHRVTVLRLTQIRATLNLTCRTTWSLESRESMPLEVVQAREDRRCRTGMKALTKIVASDAQLLFPTVSAGCMKVG
jgi:hypothetical protein